MSFFEILHFEKCFQRAKHFVIPFVQNIGYVHQNAQYYAQKIPSMNIELTITKYRNIFIFDQTRKYVK